MKKTTKILSVFLALVMVFSCIPMTAFADDRTDSLENYLSNDSLAVTAEKLLTDLGDRKEELVPTVLNICFLLIDDLKDEAAAAGVDVNTATTEQLADCLISYLDDVLADADLNSEIKDFGWILSIINIDIELNSVDGILGTLVDAFALIHGSNSRTWGDLYSMDVSMLEAKKGVAISAKDSALDVVYALFDFLSDSDNVKVIKKVIKGELSLGSINGTVKLFADGLDLQGEVNNMMGSLDEEINKLLYDNLVADWVEKADGEGKEIAVAYEDSQYYTYTSDELLAAALIKFCTGKDVSKADAAAATELTLNELIGKYADGLIEQYVIGYLNGDLKTTLTQFIEADANLAILKDIFNLNYEFKVSDFDFTNLAVTGIFEGLNDLVCGILKVILQPAVVTELNLKDGGNENITANLTSVFSYVLKTLSTYNGGKLEFTIDSTPYSFDFSAFTAAKLASMSLEDMLVEVVEIFYPTLLGVSVPSDVDSLDELLLYTAYFCIDKYMVKPDECAFTTDYKNHVFNADGSVKTLDETAWTDTIGTMAMEVAIYWLDRATDFGMSQEKIAELKAAGWTWEDFLEDIVDWALGYIKGIPAVSDKLSIERGVSDGYGAWYKLNVVINELVPMNFVNGCGDETFVVDTYTLFIDKLVSGLLTCDLKEFTDVLAMNKDTENIFNQPVISGVLGLVDNLLFSFFEHDCSDTATFTKAATATKDGYEGTYCKSNGHYMDDVTVTPATGGTDDPVDPPIPPIDEPKVTLGDVDGNGKVNASDARKILRHSAKLELLDDAGIAAADVDGNNKVNASDARKVLRHSAKLELIG